MKTRRGQSARITQENEKYFIELYSNGNWGKAYGIYGKEFKTEEEAKIYFELKKDEMHS